MSASSRILLVEDNPGDALLFQEAVASIFDHPSDVETAHSLASALTRLESEPWDLVVLDFGLPDARGPQALERIRSSYSDIPLVVLTGATDETVGPLAIKLGAHEFIAKRDLSADSLGRVFKQAVERKERRAQERQMADASSWAALGQLSSGIAHEINNPAAYVLLSLEDAASELERLRRAPRSFESEEIGEVRGRVLEAVDGVKRICALIQQLDNLSPVRHGTIESVHLDEVVKSAVSAVSHEVRARGVLNVRTEVVPSLLGDRHRLIQVVVNLILNACQAFDRSTATQGHIEVALEAAPNHIALSVEDDGPGIPESIQAKIFEPFFSTRRSNGGSGLGLAVSRATVESHGGRITVESGGGKTRFIVHLPVTTGLSPSPAPAPAKAPDTIKTILIIDDEVRLLEALSRRLSNDFDVATATSAAEGLELITRRKFDVVLCDLVMPKQDGTALYRQVADEHPEALTRWIFMTGGVYTPSIRAFLEGVDIPVLPKPVDTSQLMTSIARLSNREDSKP